MKAHKLFKKAVAVVLALALALGIAPGAIGGSIKAYAESATPSVSAYATKAQLTDGTFKPNSDGTAANIGRIKFGDKAWYLLGGDGTNVDVFAADDFGNAVFQDQSSNSFTPDTEAWNSVDYGSVAKPDTVYTNNYGASDLRVALQTLASGDTFNAVEKGMMNETTVSTTDLKNMTTYTTKDKLYLASAGDGVYTTTGITIDVNGKKLNTYTVYKDGYNTQNSNYFWLRSPCNNNYFVVLGAIPGIYVTGVSDTASAKVRPVANLDFSSVLFASAAPAAAQNTPKTNISSGTAMNLRLEAKDSDAAVTKGELGGVSVNTTDGTITATLGTGSATLVVQGNDGTSDWYYTKALSAATTTIRASDIANDVDLANCKVWLEKVGSDGMIYATESPVEYTITTSVTNGTITPSGATQVEKGESLTVEYQANEGYTLKSITVDGEAVSITDNPTSYTFSDVQAAHSISVEFEPEVYTITYNGLEDATVSGNPESYTVESDTITLNSPTKTGYAFEGWTTDGVTEPTKDLKIEQGSTGNKTFTANWVIYTYVVTFDAGDQISEVMVDYDHKITKPDDPTKDGYKFGGWYTDQACTTAWDFDEDTVTKDLTLYAKWTKVDGNGGSGSDNNGSGSSDADDSDSSSKTGDDTNVLGLLAILTLAGAGAGTVFIRRRHS